MQTFTHLEEDSNSPAPVSESNIVMKLIVEACVCIYMFHPDLSLILAYFLGCLLVGERRVSGPLIQYGPLLRAAPGKIVSMEGYRDEASMSPLSLVISAPLLTSCHSLSPPSCLYSLHIQIPLQNLSSRLPSSTKSFPIPLQY